jgi:hypothetical protein
LIFHVSEYGAYGRKLLPKSIGANGDVRVLQFACQDETDMDLVVIHETKDWYVIGLVLTPPCHPRLAGLIDNCGLTLQISGCQLSPEVWGANHGFHSMTTHFMNKLMTDLKMKFRTGERPKKEFDTMKVLAEHMKERDMSEIELADIWAFRNRPIPKDVIKGLELEDETQLEFVKELLHPSDVSDVVNLEKDRGVKAKARPAPRPPLPPPMVVGGPSGSSSSGAPVPIPVPVPRAPPMPARAIISLKGSKTPAWVKTLLPVIKGCAMTKDTVRHFRWAAQYPLPAPRHTVSKAWNTTGFSEATSLEFCLTKIWAWHTESTGQACPFVFHALG